VKSALLALIACAAPAWAGGVKNLSDADGTSCCARLATQDDNVYVVWQDNLEGNLNLRVYLARSTNGGKTFADPVDLSGNSFSDAANAAIALDGDDVHVVWTFLGEGTGDIFHTRSQDSGQTFDVAVNLSGTSGPSFYPDVRAQDGLVWVTWEEAAGAATNAMLRRSIDGGEIFEAVKNLSNSPGRSGYPQLAVSGDHVYVVWEDESDGDTDVLLARSTDSGAIFGVPVDLSDNDAPSTHAALAVQGDTVLVAWDDFDFELGEILLRRSTDGGANFGAAVNVSESEGAVSQRPALAIDGDTVHVAWEDDATGDVDLFHRRSTDGGDTWLAAQNLSEANDGISARPVIAALLGKVVVAWADYTKGGPDVLVAVSKTDGDKFTKGKSLSGKKKFGLAEGARIVISEGSKAGKAGDAVVVFEWVTNDEANRDIFVTRR